MTVLVIFKVLSLTIKKCTVEMGTGRFGKVVSAKKISRRLGKFFMPKRPVISWFFFGFLQTG